MLPAVQTLLLKYCSDSVTGRIFGYNQSFMYLGNVAGPLIGASVSAMAGFRWVFIATAIIVLINIWRWPSCCAAAAVPRRNPSSSAWPVFASQRQCRPLYFIIFKWSPITNDHFPFSSSSILNCYAYTVTRNSY